MEVTKGIDDLVFLVNQVFYNSQHVTHVWMRQAGQDPELLDNIMGLFGELATHCCGFEDNPLFTASRSSSPSTGNSGSRAFFDEIVPVISLMQSQR